MPPTRQYQNPESFAEFTAYSPTGEKNFPGSGKEPVIEDVPKKDIEKDPHIAKVEKNLADFKARYFKDIAEKHIFEGEIKNGQAGGVHHMDAITNGKARMVGPETPGTNGVFKAKVSVKNGNGGWIDKISNNGYSSFFPKAWSRETTIEEIMHAYSTKVYRSGNTWEGLSSNGIVITFYLRSDGSIISAFPKI